MSNYYNMESLIDQQVEIEKLKSERDALAAQVEALKAAIEKWQATDDSRLLADALAATPQHHLRERDAEKGRAGFVEGVDFVAYHLSRFSEQKADQYAEQIRRGEVE